MKVVHVVRQFHPSVGGLEDAVLNLARIQRRELGIDARVVTLDRLFTRPDTVLPALDIVDGIPVRRLRWWGSSRYPIAPSVLNAVRGADLVHVHAIDFFFDFLALTRPLHRIPLVASTHGGFFHSSFASQAKRVFFATVTRGSCLAYRRIIACSESDADMFRPIVADNRLVTIENGVDLEKFAGAASPIQTRTILSYGRFARHKRMHLLFPLLAALRAQDPSWRLIVAGSEADATLASLEAAAAKAGVTDAVRFVLQPSNAELRTLMGQASYYASASEHEGFGIAAVEAMSAGLVTILSDIPPFRRLVERTGVGVALDFLAPSKAALSVVSMFAELRSIGSAEDAVSGMDWRHVAGAYAREYRDQTLTPETFAVSLGG
ncbi:MAG: glycosyltransferase family 4 protein [Janthinobacterium lividum]